MPMVVAVSAAFVLMMFIICYGDEVQARFLVTGAGSGIAALETFLAGGQSTLVEGGQSTVVAGGF
jgi:hypothetical protein